jgi:hypothetical protein
VPDPILATSLAPWVAAFAGAFTEPSFRSFQQLLVGWILCTARHTVTGVLRAAGATDFKHDTSFHRFFRTARWEPDTVGLLLVQMVAEMLDANERIVTPLDDTLARHTGKHISAASMHHDPLLSTRTKAVFHFGHVWVVLSIVVTISRWDKSFALPVLVRLYRSKKVCEQEGRPFFKKTELAAQMIAKLAEALPAWAFHVVADAAYANRSIVKKLPSNVHFIGRSRLDAALYDVPDGKQRMGRPRVKGKRLPSPEARGRSPRRWTRLQAELFGETVTLQVKQFDALWYVVSGSRLMRFVLVRGWPGHDHDDVFCCTDLELDAAEILRLFCLRWKLEVTFQEAKGRLGFEDPQCRAERAVERTAPMALWTYTITVLWYATVGHRLPVGRLRADPWYEKTVPTFSDMLAAIRREIWRHRVLDPLGLSRRDQKSLDPLLHAAAVAA